MVPPSVRPHRLVFLGPPGAGKGTQAAIVAAELGVPHLSTGDMLRAAVKEGTELGRAADAHMRAGGLVPDALVFDILGERLRRPDAASGFVLDGFPRNLAQARELERRSPLDAVLWFELPPTVLIERLTGRRVCPKCGTVYNVVSNPPGRAGRCDRDGTELQQRPDDRPEAVDVRLRVYGEQTAPLLGHYRATGLLRPLDARGSPAEVTKRLRGLLETSGDRRPTQGL